MSLQKSFAINKSAESEGTWIEICANDDGPVARFKIARAGRRNKRYTKAMEKATKPYRAILGDLDTKTDDKITAGVLAEAIILDWEHVQDVPGTDLAFSKEAALEILQKYPDLIDLVNNKAWQMETFRDEQLEDDAKN
jgi:hypothetical protein